MSNSNQEQKMRRDEYPSGWLTLTRNEAAVYIVDALLDLPPHREFNQTELAEEAGVTRQSVAKYLPLFTEIGIVDALEDRSRTRYQFVPENPISEAIIRLDGQMNAAGEELHSE